ncbi:MAG: AAA family ATPase [Acidobacteriota bacterium]
MGPAYQTTECIFDGARSRVYRAVAGDGRPVVVKQLRELYPGAATIARFSREFEITRSAAGPGVIEAYELRAHEGTVSIVLEDFGAASVAAALGKGPHALDVVLPLAARIADALARVHALGIVHKDVNPSNVVWNQGTDEVKLIDFGISQVLGREPASPSFDGTPRYMSPEQTGRMNRSVDCRSDLYSLGAMLYELLTGVPPFPSEDRLELVHAHIARTPVSPQEIRSEIPDLVARLCLTLLAKRAEDRYQTARGLAHDLGRCLEHGRAKPPAPAFALREKDRDGQLRIPQKLYGRDAEAAALLSAFERTAQGGTGLLLVAGYSGIGKTSLVHEVQRELAGRRGCFVEGKFDQFNRGIPYDSLIQAFRNLVRHVLSENEERIARWKGRIWDALGENGRVLIDVIPEAEHLIGPQAQVEDVSPAEARNRFQMVIGGFVRAMASADHPLVIFLDDLQWADLPSMELINRLVTDPDAGHVLFIGAYRDNEVGDAHPLAAAIADMRSDGASLETIHLGPLSEEDVRELVADTVMGAPGNLRLALACHGKTGGNAFFLNRFLESLHGEGLLRYEGDRWTWDLDTIQSLAITETVVDFMSRRIQRMSIPARRSLEIAACIGNTFDLRTLAYLRGATRKEMLENLREALKDELLRPAEQGFWYVNEVDEESTNFVYRFAHDRIRQAAHDGLDREDAASIHLRAGRFMLAEMTDGDPRLFEIVEHLDRAIHLIDEEDERERLCELNLAAGRRALASAAFQPAHGYYLRAHELQGEDAWTRRYERTLAIHVEGARAAYLGGDHAVMQARVTEVIEHGRTIVDRVEAQEVAIYALVSQERFADAVKAAIGVLGQLGVEMPAAPTKAQVGQAVGATLEALGGTSPEAILALPETADAAVEAAMRIQNGVMSSAYLAMPDLLPLLACSIVGTTLARGVCKQSAYGFAVFALVLSAINEIDKAYENGRVSLGLLDRWDDRALRPNTMHVVSGLVNPFVEPVRNTLDVEARVYRLGIDTGNLEYACWALHHQANMSFYAGVDLPAAGACIDRAIGVLKHHKQLPAVSCTVPFGQAVRCLVGQSPDPARLAGPEFDESEQLAALRAVNFRGATCIVSTLAAFLRYIFRDLEAARSMADLAMAYADGASSTYHVVWAHQYRALSILGLCDATAEGVGAAVDAVQSNLAQLRTWQRFSPGNHAHRVHLVEAEIARVEGRRGDALDLYDRAIEAARQGQFVHEEALASELAARFHAARGARTAARAYMLEACYGYNRWGATAKVTALEREAGDLLAGFRIAPADAAPGSTATATSSSQEASQRLDLETLFKAANIISGEIRLESLLEKIMGVAIENAGATRGFLIMDRGGDLRVDASRDADGRRLAEQGTPVAKCPGLPQSLVTYVHRTGERLVLNDAAKDSRWAQDPELRRDRPMSILCAPVVHQGAARGLVYLENDLTTGAFTPARIEVLELLCTQAAISITNATLYGNLDAALREQVELTAAHRRFVPHQFLENLGRRRIADVALGDSVRKQMSILFSDMRGFTTHVEGLSGEESIGFINDYLSHMEPPIHQYHGFVDSYIGDAIMALFDEAGDALRAGIAMLRALRRLNAERERAGRPTIPHRHRRQHGRPDAGDDRR